MDNRQKFYSLYKLNNNVSIENYKGTLLYVCDMPTIKDNKLIWKKEPYRNQQYAKKQYEFNKEMDNFIFSEDMCTEMENIETIQSQIKKYNKILDKQKESLKELFINTYKSQYNKDVPDFIFKD